MIRRVLLVYVAVLAVALLWSRVEAATVPARLPANVTFNAGAYSVNGAAAGAAVAGASTVSLGGGATASIPVAYRLGELAGIAARTAIRANAVMLGTQVVMDWLLPYGLKKCQDSGWCSGGTPEQAPNGKPFPKADGYFTAGYAQGVYGPLETTCQADLAYWQGQQPTRGWTLSGWHWNQVGANGKCMLTDNTGYTWDGPLEQYHSGCPTNFQEVAGMCNPPGYVPATPSAPATDADWAKVPVTNVPDAVLTGVMQQGKQWLPADPQVSTQVQTVPLSGVYKDPTTGVSYRDMAYVTPNPSDPQTATLQLVKTQVDPATGNPVTDPTTGNATGTAKAEDPCLANPNRVGCMDKGDIPTGPDLSETQKTITITPDSGWGPETMACPADIVTMLHGGGGAVAYSFKAQCDFADGVRAPVIAIAWVAAVLIALGVGSKGGE